MAISLLVATFCWLTSLGFLIKAMQVPVGDYFTRPLTTYIVLSLTFWLLGITILLLLLF